MASFDFFDRSALDFWADPRLHHGPLNMPGDWTIPPHSPSTGDVRRTTEPGAFEPDPMAFASLLERESLQVDLTRWHYDDDAVAGDLEQYRQNLQDIADRISDELSGFEPRHAARDRPLPSVECADETAESLKQTPKAKSSGDDGKKKKKAAAASTSSPSTDSSPHGATMAIRPGPVSRRSRAGNASSEGRQG